MSIKALSVGLQLLIHSLLINLPIVFLINIIIILCLKYQKILKNAYYNLPEPMVTSTNCLFCQTSGTKPKNIHFTMIQNGKKQQVFTLENEEPENIRRFHLINNLNDYQYCQNKLFQH